MVGAFLMLGVGDVGAAPPVGPIAHGAPDPGRVDVASDLTPDPARARVLIGEVLASPDFGGERTLEVWVPVGWGDGGGDPDVGEASEVPWLARLLAWALRLLLILAAFGLLVAVLWRLWRDWLPRRRHGRARRGPAPARHAGQAPSPPGPGAGLDLERLSARARARLAAGDLGAALALLYQGSIQSLRLQGLALPDGLCEGECLALAVRSLGSARAAPLGRLIHAWQGVAYGRRRLPEVVVAGLIDEWEGWSSGLDEARGRHEPLVAG